MSELQVAMGFQAAEAVAAGLVGGVLTVLLGVALAFAGAVRAALHDADDGQQQRQRWRLGRALLLGLEFLVAADVIRSVAIAPTLEGVAVLALLVVVRTFLNWTLEREPEAVSRARVPQLGGRSAFGPSA